MTGGIPEAGAAWAGGCLCGAVRYSADGPPVATVLCHCRNCQKQSGSALSIVIVFPRAALAVRGDLALFVDTAASGRAVERRFCPACGSPVVTDTDAARDQGIIFVKAGTLDDPSRLQPTTHYWAASAQDWFPFTGDLEKCAGQ